MRNLEEDCKKFLGLEPFDDWTNMSANDQIFYCNIISKYGEDNVVKMCYKLKLNARY